MVGRFPHLSAFTKKLTEICGAGLASAAAACLIGQTDKPVAPPLAPVVYLSPADVQVIKLLHNDRAALLEQLQSLPESPAPLAALEPAAAAPAVTPTPVSPSLASPSPATPPKSAAAVPSRREAKADRTPAPVLAVVRQRLDAAPVVVATLPSNAPPLAGAPSPIVPEVRETPDVTAPATVADEAVDLMSSLKQIPGWFWPAGGGLLSEAPRPPMPVGNLLRHLM